MYKVSVKIPRMSIRHDAGVSASSNVTIMREGQNPGVVVTVGPGMSAFLMELVGEANKAEALRPILEELASLVRDHGPAEWTGKASMIERLTTLGLEDIAEVIQSARAS
jgi:sulfite reductase beta subunit-like hemoprotein